MSLFPRLDPDDYALPPAWLERTLSPTLLVYLDVVRGNLRRVIEALGDRPDRWRAHVKTSKIPEIFTEMLHAGVGAFKCATTREAACLARVLDEHSVHGADVLIAYPLIDPALEYAGRLAAELPGVGLSVLCEDPSAVESIPALLGVFADVNPGMNRTGVPITDRQRVKAIARGAGDRFRGIHFYEGHVRGVPAKVRREQTRAALGDLLDLATGLIDLGIGIDEVVTSGTPTFLDALGDERLTGLTGTVHRVSPGTVVLHDLNSQREIPELGLKPAALVLSRVVSHPAPGMVTCDAGSKSVAAEAGDPCAEVIGHGHLEALRPSEEHLPLRVHDNRAPPDRGTPLLLIPRHVCPTVNLAEQAVLIDCGPVARVVDVAARAHDVLAGT